MISSKTYYDVHTARTARFSKSYSVIKAIKMSATTEGKIKLFEDYYRGWFIIPFNKNLREGTALIATSVLFSLCDVIEQFQRGQKSANNTTRDFVKSVLHELYGGSLGNLNERTIDDYLNQLYDKLRNGLQHELACRNVSIVLSSAITTMLRIDDMNNTVDEIFFNPSHFLKAVDKKLSQYIQQLNDESNLLPRSNFEKMFRLIFDIEDLENHPKTIFVDL